jgi:hypothetical protein
MLTLSNEPDDGLVITLARVHDVEAHARPVPAGELVRIVGLAVDEADRLALWSVAWHGNEYFCLPGELRPACGHERPYHESLDRQ